MRLLVVVEQTPDVLTAILNRQPPLQELINNEWIILASKSPSTAAIERYCPRRGWLPWSGKAVLPQGRPFGRLVRRRVGAAGAGHHSRGGAMSPLFVHLPDWVWLVPALPLVAVVINAVRVLLGSATGDAAEPLTARLSSLAAFGGFALMLAIDALALSDGAPGHRRLGHWFGNGNWGSQPVFHARSAVADARHADGADRLARHPFSANYLHREAGFHRFFIALGFFLAGIQIVLLAGNGVLAFVGWEMCGVSSFLLIGYAWHRLWQPATRCSPS